MTSIWVDELNCSVDVDDTLKNLYFRLKRKFPKLIDCCIIGAQSMVEFNKNVSCTRSTEYYISIWLDNNSHIYIHFNGDNDYTSTPIKIIKKWREQPSLNYYTKTLWRKHWWIR